LRAGRASGPAGSDTRAAVTRAQALLATGDGVIATEGDARDPEAILASPALAGVIDLTEPVGLLLVSMLDFFTAGAFPRRRLVKRRTKRARCR